MRTVIYRGIRCLRRLSLKGTGGGRLWDWLERFRRWCVLLSSVGRGLPGGNSLFFCFAKRKVSKRKGDPGVCVPSLRYGQPAVLGPAGVWLNSLRSDNASPDPSGPPLLGAYTRGGGKNTEYLKKQGLAMASPCLYWCLILCLSVPAPDCPVLAGLRSADVGGSGIALV